MRAALVAVLALLFVAPASAGGWATAELAPPENINAGDTWTAKVTILQHGRTPMDGVKPVVIVSDGKASKIRVAARWTGKPGLYEAKVRIPHSGTWHYAVYDGFTQYGNAQVHGFPAFKAGAAGDRGLSLSVWPFLALFGLVLVGGVAYRARPR
jgi:YtkA-like protein